MRGLITTTGHEVRNDHHRDVFEARLPPTDRSKPPAANETSQEYYHDTLSLNCTIGPFRIATKAS